MKEKIIMKWLQRFKHGFWNIGVIDTSLDRLLSGREYSINWMKHRYGDRFFADPFIYNETDEYYMLLAEEFRFIDKIGRIVLLTVRKKDMRLIKKEYYICEDHHLSFPFIFEGKIIPEGFRGGKLHSYQEDKDTLHRSVVVDLPLIDSIILEYHNQSWLFCTTRENNKSALQTLSIFFKDENSWVPHAMGNPVKVNIRNSRPAGNFFEYEGELYRPAQNCEEFYGQSIVIMKIIKLSTTEFEEEEFMEINSNSREYKGMHTFNIASDSVIIDGYKEKIYLRKLCFTKFAWLFQIFYREPKGIPIEE